MPNIKSAKKRVLVNAKKTEQNKAIRSAVKTEIKKIDTLIKDNKLDEAKVALSNAFKVIDSACSKNIFHANNAANKKAKLSKKVNAALSSAPAEEVVATVIEEPVVEPVEAPAKKTTTRKPRAKKTDDSAEAPAKAPATRKPRAKKAEVKDAE